MNAAKYFSPRYWARKFFAVRPAGTVAKVYVGSGGVTAAGSAETVFVVSQVRHYTGTGGVYAGGAAETRFVVVARAVPVVLYCGDEAAVLVGARTDALVLRSQPYPPAHAFYAGPVSLCCAEKVVILVGARSDRVQLPGEEIAVLPGAQAHAVALKEGG